MDFTKNEIELLLKALKVRHAEIERVAFWRMGNNDPRRKQLLDERYRIEQLRYRLEDYEPVVEVNK